MPFGIIGGRLYHVITDPELYFTAGRQPIRALYIWDGGLGIPGAVALGAIGAAGLPSPRHQTVRLRRCRGSGAAAGTGDRAMGNYFNQELYGRPSRLPWALYIDPAHRPTDSAAIALYHPTFLYESLWDLGVMALLLWLDSRHQQRLRRGRLFAC